MIFQFSLDFPGIIRLLLDYPWIIPGLSLALSVISFLYQIRNQEQIVTFHIFFPPNKIYRGVLVPKNVCIVQLEMIIAQSLLFGFSKFHFQKLTK